MTAAGVQNLEPAAYLPPPPSASASDAKSSGAPDAHEDQPNFQRELDMQEKGAQETKEPAQTKTGAGKSEKKKDSEAEVPSFTVVAPVPVVETQKQILPLVLALPAPTPDEHADPDVKSEEPVQESHEKRLSSVEPHVSLKELERPATLYQALQLTEAPPKQIQVTSDELTEVKKDVVDEVAEDVPETQIAQLALILSAATQKAPVRQETAKSQAPAASLKSHASAEGLPLSRNELQLTADAPEPTAPTIQETNEKADSEPSTPSELAFAARMATPPPKPEGPVTVNPSQIAAVPASQTADRIPMRHAATAQILPKAGADTKGLFKERSVRTETATEFQADVKANTRTDMVMPRVETASHATTASAPVAQPQTASSTHMERVMAIPVAELPVEPPTSAHDIRVRVPNNDGGSTHVRFLESGGEVRVSVRTADSGLAQNLRTHLDDLTQRLADGGIPAEFWKPSSSASSQNDQSQPDREGRGSDGQGSGGRNGQQDRQQNRPAWLEEMEASLHGEG